MGFRVICISHTQEAGGEAIGHAVAEQLGFRYVDEEVISRAARLAQVDTDLVAAVERKQPILQRLFDALAAAQVIAGPVALSGGLPIESLHQPGAVHPSSDDLRILIRAAILELGKAGNSVIVAHAASLALAGKPGVLRVLITAPDETRALRLAQAKNMTPTAARAAISKSDAGRDHYFRTFYDVEQELPTHYDIVFSTEVLTPAQTAAVIVAAARG